MAQLNIYVPDEEASKLREEADRAGLPLSRYVTSLLHRGSDASGWPAGYFENVCGFLKDEEAFHEPNDPPPSSVDDLDGL